MSDYFAEIKSFAERQISTARQAIEGINYLQEKQEQIYQAYTKALETYEAYNPHDRALELIKESGRELLIANGMRAIEVAEEFDIPAYQAGWIRAISNPESLKYEVQGDQIYIRNNFNQTAGTLYEYARAVNQARTVVGDTDDGSAAVGYTFNEDYALVQDPAWWSSWFWEEKYYKPAREHEISPYLDPSFIQDYIQKYWDTMEARSRFFSHDAPYWLLVEEGMTPDYPESSAKANAYPATKPTRFIETTIDQLTIRFVDALRGCKSYQTRLKNEIEKLEAAYKYTSTTISKFEEKDMSEYAEKFLKSQLKERYSNADSARVDKLLDDILQGNDIKAAKSGVSLGKTPEGKRIRVRITNLQKQLRLLKI